MFPSNKMYINLGMRATNSRYATNSSTPVARPLLIACSGGTGHITAMKAIMRMFNPRELPQYTTPSYASKPYSTSGFFMYIGNTFASLLGVIPESLPVPKLPARCRIIEEVRLLEKSLERPDMPYMDMLLHAYPAGFDQASLWNYFQKNDMTTELAKLVALQHHNDDYHRTIVREGFLKILERARRSGKPYTEVISTQALGLAGLCDAVIEYNRRYGENLIIHQYMTDLPSTGAVHFFNALSRLNSEQQNRINLYAVEMRPEVIRHFFRDGHYFQGLYNIDPKDNPMVRPAFTNPDYDFSDKFEQDIVLSLKGLDPQPIRANEKIASILLGGQAGIDSIKYILPLLAAGMDKVFLFAGSNRVLIDEVTKLQTERGLADRIILLPNQDDIHVASIISRSNVVVTRAGGGTVMEHLAMKHNPNQKIMLHHKDTHSAFLTTGIAWEDGNANLLIDKLKEADITAVKTTPKQVREQLAVFYPESSVDLALDEEWDIVNDEADDFITEDWDQVSSIEDVSPKVCT